jgi:hypothetical protein
MSEVKAARLARTTTLPGAVVSNRGRFAAGVALALSALALGAPTASAGCGRDDSVISLRTMGSPAANSPGENLSTQPVEHKSGKRPRPCSGPTCSGRRSLPPVSSVLMQDQQPEWACIAMLAALANPESRWRPRDFGTNRPVWGTTEVFHPPRPASSYLQSFLA